MVLDLRDWSKANLRYLADLILPPVCIHCHEPVTEHGLLCAACWQGIDFITPPLCDRLGVPLPYASDAPTLSTAALREPPVFGRARAAARFNGAMRNLIHSFKYADRHEGADMFAHLMQAAGGELLSEADMLMPVPLHPQKLWKRRFNQAAILAGKLSMLTGLPVDVTSLQRKRRTPSQVGLSFTDRQSNVAAAFRLRAGRASHVRGKRILLIDDVLTTGATVSACARVLKEGGAAEVDCLAIAMAISDGAGRHPQWPHDGVGAV